MVDRRMEKVTGFRLRYLEKLGSQASRPSCTSINAFLLFLYRGRKPRLKINNNKCLTNAMRSLPLMSAPSLLKVKTMYREESRPQFNGCALCIYFHESSRVTLFSGFKSYIDLNMIYMGWMYLYTYADVPVKASPAEKAFPPPFLGELSL